MAGRFWISYQNFQIKSNAADERMDRQICLNANDTVH